MKQPRVMRLESLAAYGAESIGPKAHSLVRLMQLGMRVPPGFCVSAEAYRDHLGLWGLDTSIPSRLEQYGQIAGGLAEIRQEIIRSDFSADLTQSIRQHYSELNNSRVAVRSSATAEDLPGYSFAGQYESFLGVQGAASCLEAIKKCWASLWTERAFAYREKNGIEHLDVHMAVIVQQQVEADCAGVLFTSDPVRGQTDRIVIEACKGLGEALVSGRVTPDEMIFSKKKLKPIWILPADLNGPGCLDPRTGRRLAKAGRTIEQTFGRPQDIEWAVADGRIYFLQARPVTTPPVEQTWEERQIWTNTNLGEVAPDVITPLDWSIVTGALMPLFGNLAWILGIEMGTHPLIDRVAGRLYFNFNMGMGLITKLPSFLMKPQEADVLFGGGDKEQYDLRKIRFGPDDLPDLQTSVWKILWRGPRSAALVFSRRYSKALKILERMKQHNRHYRGVSYSSMSMQESVALLEEIFERCFASLDLLYMVIPMLPAAMVGWLCERWFHDHNSILAHSLLKAAGHMDDVQAGVALSELARVARQDAEVQEIVGSGVSWDQVQANLRQTEAGREFIQRWGQFMQRHGHHCRSEILTYNSRWAERPDYILTLVKGCMENPERQTPGQFYPQQVQNQQQEIDRVAGHLRNPLKRWFLRRQVRRAQQGLAFRENIKSEVVRLLFLVRQIILDLGRKMRSEGILAKAEDIFFFEFEELKSVLQGQNAFDIAQQIQQRRGDYEQWKAIDPPQVIVGQFDPAGYVPPSVDTGIRVFHGMSVCPGKVTGKARVILRADETQQVLPGEILVAPFTDPGWTPYFVNAAGIVMDQGGLLSHGSIVAREYGIPAVVNVGPATKIIQTGQILFLDADQGTITLTNSI